MGQTKEQRIIKQLSGTPTNQKFTPIATDMFLPNHSGISHNPEATNNFLKLDCSNDPLTGVLQSTADQSSADTAYVPMVLYNTDATPPTASGFPIGTIYIQYTA